jgi:hypothetical protein
MIPEGKGATMKRTVMAMIVLALVTAAALARNQRWTGYVSDAKCGAKVDVACAKKCIEAGEKVVFVNDGDKVVIPVTNPEALKGHEGHHVMVEGKLENNALTVSKVKMVDEAKKVQDATY